MIVKQLKIKNFMGYRDRIVLDFSNKPIVAIAGCNESGKSTILQAITYALYGRTRAAREVHLINSNADGSMIVNAVVELHDGTVLEIERGRTARNEAILSLEGFNSDKPSEISVEIKRKLPISYDDFVSLSYFVQGDIHQFMLGNKREYFQRWTEPLRIWGKFEGEAHRNQGLWQEQFYRNTQELKDLSDTVSQEEEIEEWFASAQKRLQKASLEHEEAQTHLLDARANLAMQQASDELLDALNEMTEQLQDVQDRLQTIEWEIRDLEKSITGYTHGRCPMLDIHCEELALDSKHQIEDAAARMDTLVVEREQCKKKRVALTVKTQRIKDKLAAVDITQAKDEVLGAQTQLEMVRIELNKAEKEVINATMHKERVEQAKVKYAELQQNVQAVEKEYKFWSKVKYICGKSGIPAELLDTSLADVEEKCNWVLDRLGYRKRIRFAGQRVLAGYERHCAACGGSEWMNKECVSCGSPRPRSVKDEPTITVLDGEHERPFELESGGAQVLQSFAVRLACSLFVASMIGIPLQLIMLDETFAMLDAENRQKLLSLVVDRLSHVFGLKQQFVISHQEDVTNSIDNVLLVTKERGVSAARWL